ncbi:MAG: hypothetical protein ACKPKO_42890, partial [Candidatus Fonsibacter sp.]
MSEVGQHAEPPSGEDLTESSKVCILLCIAGLVRLHVDVPCNVNVLDSRLGECTHGGNNLMARIRRNIKRDHRDSIAVSIVGLRLEVNRKGAPWNEL